MPYKAPLNDLLFLLNDVLEMDRVSATERYAEATDDLRAAVLGEGAKLAEDILDPVNRAGDLTPAKLENGVVRTSPGFAEAYGAIAEGGWVGISADPEYGGMGLPQTMAVAMTEMMSSACLSLSLNPLMTQGQIDALEHHASDTLKDIYLPKLISGEWSGTMNLTEPQAGSDVGALRSKAEDNGDGTYSVSGQKIFISWGDSDFAGNICHLVLARLPDGVPGTKGISLFLVPKYLPDAQGNPGKQNSLKVVSLEHKLGLHGSPTAVMEFDNATGWMVGAPHKGMSAMFTMMNNARVGVGAEGLGVAERAMQQALEFAAERKQGKTPVAGGGAILDHADVRRMVLTMKAQVAAARSILYATSVAGDLGTTGDADQKARAAFLTPIAKAFCTDTGIEVSNLGIQVHGGMGFVEETGAAQYLRDVRVTAIYEGTNGIQSMDLVGRKLMDGGAAARSILAEMAAEVDAAKAELPELAARQEAGLNALSGATDWMLAQSDMNERFAGSVAYLRAFAFTLGGHFLLKSARLEGGSGKRTDLASFFLRRMAPQIPALAAEAMDGQSTLYAFSADALAG